MKKKSPSVFFLLFIIAFIGSFILFSLPGSSIPRYKWLEIPYLDKYIHMGIFFTLCYTGAVSISILNKGKFYSHHSIFVGLSFLCYGIGIEYYQESFIEGRAFEIADIIADGIGCLFFLIWFLFRGLPKKSWSR
jgi:VanZ family protein